MQYEKHQQQNRLIAHYTRTRMNPILASAHGHLARISTQISIKNDGTHSQ